MKKIILSDTEIKEIIRLYNEELLGSPSIAKIMGYSKPTIIKTLKDNGVVMGKSGRRYIGGKSASDKRYYEKNKDKISEYYKEWSENNRNYLREYHNKWRNDNKEVLNKYRREYERDKKHNNYSYKLSCYTRTAIYTSLKESNVVKYSSTFDLLGYSLDDLIKHLENLFTDGMTWDNYGEWHVDHIKPISSFNFDSEDCAEFKQCWSLDNLQPLWAKDNLSKGAKIE